MKEKKKKRKDGKKWLPKLTKVKAIQTAKGVVLEGGSGLIGALGAAGFGKWGLAFGGLLLLAGNYVDKDIRHYFSIAGIGALVQTVAKWNENEAISDDAAINGVGFVAIKEGAKNRLLSFKNDWLKALRIDKLIKPKAAIDSGVSIGAIDLSALEALDDSVKASAVQFQMDQMEDEEGENYAEYQNDQIEFSEQGNELEEMNGIYAEEEFDFNTI